MHTVWFKLAANTFIPSSPKECNIGLGDDNISARVYPLPLQIIINSNGHTIGLKKTINSKEPDYLSEGGR